MSSSSSSVYFYQLHRFYNICDLTQQVNAMKPSWLVHHTNTKWTSYVLENVTVSFIATAVVTRALQTSFINMTTSETVTDYDILEIHPDMAG
jgi:hypothetical protein